MKVTLESKSITEIKCDVLIVNEFEGIKHPGGATGAIDKALDGEISKLLASGEITGKLGETVPVRTFCKLPADEVINVGLGKSTEFDYDKVRIVADAAIKAAKRNQGKEGRDHNPRRGHRRTGPEACRAGACGRLSPWRIQVQGL